MFKLGDRVFYDGMYWTVVAIHRNGRMLDLRDDETNKTMLMVYASDCQS